MAAPSGARPNWKAEGNRLSLHFGESVGTAGDVNGDGYDDVIVGTGAQPPSEGQAFVYHGSPSGLSTTPDWAQIEDQDAHFGWSVGTAGDVNGDGYDDIIVGADSYHNDLYEEGKAFVYHGSASGLSTTADWTAEGDQVLAYFGRSVGTAGDVNGDGYDDVIVGARYYNNDQTNEGRVFVYYGSASGLSATADWTAESNQTDSHFGESVGTAGDVNGDGYDDVVVGAHFYDNGQLNEGRAFLYLGSAWGLATTPYWTAESDQEEAHFGESVGTAGDVNGDGYDDVVVGAYLYDNGLIGQPDEGRAFVYYGSTSGLSTTPDWTAESDQPDAHFGSSVGTARDVNGDGYDDVIVGAEWYDNGQTNEGVAVVYFGSAWGLATTPYWMAESDQNYAYFGSSVGTAGDVNGDGYDDGIGGARSYDHGEGNDGMAAVFHGRATAPPR